LIGLLVYWFIACLRCRFSRQACPNTP